MVQGIQRGQSVAQRVERGSYRALGTPGADRGQKWGELPPPRLFCSNFGGDKGKATEGQFSPAVKKSGHTGGIFEGVPRGKNRGAVGQFQRDFASRVKFYEWSSVERGPHIRGGKD